MKAIMVEKAKTVKLVEVPKPSVNSGWALIKVMASAICATDLELIDGNIPAHYPIIPGHEWSGVVEAVGNVEDSQWIGKRVVGSNDIVCLNCEECRSGRWRYCKSFKEIGFKANGAYAEYIAVPVYGLFELPDSISFVQGALIEPLCVALGTIEKAGVRLGDTVTVMGAGSIGLNLLAAAKAAGARRIIVTASSRKRLGFAEKLGAYATVAVGEEYLRSFIEQKHGGASDVILEATGMEECIRSALQIVKKGGSVALAGYGRDKELMIHIDDIHINNVKVVGAGNNWGYIRKAIHLLEDGILSTEMLATHFIRLEEYETGIEMARMRPQGFIKAVYTF